MELGIAVDMELDNVVDKVVDMVADMVAHMMSNKKNKTSKLNHRCASHTCAYLRLLTYVCSLYNISHRFKL